MESKYVKTQIYTNVKDQLSYLLSPFHLCNILNTLIPKFITSYTQIMVVCLCTFYEKNLKESYFKKNNKYKMLQVEMGK